MTPRQREIYLWIGRYIAANQRSPTVREIGEAMGIASPNGVTSHIESLERKGWLERVGVGRHRSIVLPAVTVVFDPDWEPNKEG